MTRTRGPVQASTRGHWTAPAPLACYGAATTVGKIIRTADPCDTSCSRMYSDSLPASRLRVALKFSKLVRGFLVPSAHPGVDRGLHHRPPFGTATIVKGMRASREERHYARERTPFAPTDRELAGLDDGLRGTSAGADHDRLALAEMIRGAAAAGTSSLRRLLLDVRQRDPTRNDATNRIVARSAFICGK
jgi:hypothetical protein